MCSPSYSIVDWYGDCLIFTELTLISDNSVEEGGIVNVMVTLCGNITDGVVVSVMTDNGTAGIAQHFSISILDMSLTVDCPPIHEGRDLSIMVHFYST